MKKIFKISIVLLALFLIAAQFMPQISNHGVVYLSDFPDLQTAVNAAPNGGTVIIDAGVHEIGNVVINQANEWQKVVTLQGVAPGHLGQHPPQNNSQWDYLLNGGYVYGSVLRGNISMTNGARLYLRDLAMIGHGSGIAVDYGDNVNMFPDGGLYHVAFGNYDTAIRLRKAYYMTLSDIDIAGVGTAIQIINSNAIHLTDIDIVACGLGVDFGGNSNSWIGGSVQACTTGVKLGGLSGALGSIYFEQISTNSVDAGGQGWSILSNYYATNSGVFKISGKNNDIVLGINPIAPIELTSTSSYNYVRGSAYLVCTDTGFRNRCEKLFP